MIDEETLSNLLAEHAEQIPVPDSAIGDLLAAAPRAEHRSPIARLTRPPARVLAAAAVVIVAAAGVWALSTHSPTATTTAAKRATAPLAVSPTTAAAAERLGLPAGTGSAPIGAVPGLTAGPDQQSSFATNTHTTPTQAARNDSPPAPADSAKVVRTGTLDLRIARHAFGQTIGRITTIAAAAGGYIADEQTFESAAVPTGTVKIRIPSARFNETVHRLRRLGTVLNASTRGIDVTGQFTDLQARLSAATATRAQYLIVLSHATAIGDILAVQDRIESVQTEIEQLQGQINELTNQTTYGSITVSVAEPQPRAKPVAKPKHPSGVSVAWDNARNGFSRRVEGIISHSGSALVVLVFLLLLGGALRLLVPRVRRVLV